MLDLVELLAGLVLDLVELLDVLDLVELLDGLVLDLVELLDVLDLVELLDGRRGNVEVKNDFRRGLEVFRFTSTIDTDSRDRDNLCQVGSKLGVPMGRLKRKGTKLGEYQIAYFPFCLMCGRQFAAKRPDAKTGSNLCRSALRRWCAKYGNEPEQPPGITPAGKQLVGCPPASPP